MRLMGVIVASLTLAACGQPASAPDGTSASGMAMTLGDPMLEAWLKAKYGAGAAVAYQSSEFDLDGDGAPETLVYLRMPTRCGSGGCRLLVLARDDHGFAEVARTTVTRLPVGVLDTSTNGWRDLWVTVGGGGMPAGRRKLAFDGASYPSNPTVPPAATVHAGAGQTLLDEGEAIAVDLAEL